MTLLKWAGIQPHSFVNDVTASKACINVMIQSYSGVSQCDLLSDKIDTFKTTKDGNHHCPPSALKLKAPETKNYFDII